MFATNAVCMCAPACLCVCVSVGVLDLEGTYGTV